MQCWYDGRESTEEAIGPLFRSFVALRAPELNSSHRERYLSEGLGTFSTEYTKTSPKRTWFLLLTKLCAALRSLVSLTLRNFTNSSVQFEVSCCVNHFRRDGSHKEKSLCSDYPENVGQNRMSGIRSYNKVSKFLDSSKTHALRRQHEPKKYNCSGQRTNTRSCSCVCPYSIRIFQVHITVVHAMNTLEFYSFNLASRSRIRG